VVAQEDRAINPELEGSAPSGWARRPPRSSRVTYPSSHTPRRLRGWSNRRRVPRWN